MAQQEPVGEGARVDDAPGEDGTREVTEDVAYLRTAIVNVVFVGPPGAGDRELGPDRRRHARLGRRRSPAAAEQRFGAGRPARRRSS